MKLKLQKRSLQSITMFVIIILLTSWFNVTKAQEPGPPPPKNAPPPLEGKQFNGTYIFWNKQQNTTQETWNWTNQAWEFGPYPNFAIYLPNGTEVTDANFIPLGTPFKVVINVKKNIFVGNTTLGRAGLQWNIQLLTKNGTNSGNANCRMIYINKMETKNWNQSNTWQTESFVFNQSETTGPIGKTPQTPEQMQQHSFYNFDKASSKMVESNESWQIEIVGSFNATSTPIGPYWVNLEVTDQYDSWIDFGYQASQGKMSPNRMIAVGKPGFVYGGYQDSWTFEKLDMENKQLYSVSKGAPWKMRINVTSSALTNITIGFDLPWNVKTFVNVTNWYQKAVTQQGGWVYNETSGTYYWNSSVLVTRTEQVFGPHLEERWVNVQHSRQVNVTREYWDSATNQTKFTIEQQWVQDKIFLIYNHATRSFDVKQGCSYFSYDPVSHGDREYLALYPLNVSDPTTRFYNLSKTDSSCNEIGPNKYSIEFVGWFSNTTYSDTDEYWMQITVNSKNGQVNANWEDINPSDFQIAVDKPVAISTILDSNGHPVKGWMFQTDLGKSFTVQSKMYGASKLYSDIDGIGVVFHSGFGKWSNNESYNSDIEIRLVKDLTTGALSSVTYNRTNRNVYVYGSHKGWAYVNVTDWYWEYNATTGQNEWVNKPHLVWNETTLTDWHWEYSRLNQTEYARDPNSPNIWIDTTSKWVSDFDPAFRMPSSYAVLNSANIALVNGVVVVNMSAAFSSSAPEGDYQWNMVFQNMTYGRDDSQGWGEHIITEWTSEPVYYVNGSVTGGNAWYVSNPTTPLYTMYAGKRYQLEQLPYITIGGVDLPIKVRTQYDQWRQEEWTEYLFRDPYDPKLGREPRYYELLNGTKIYVQEAYQAIIRTLQLNCTDAYRMIDGSKVLLPNGTVVTTYMDRAMQDWGEHFWDQDLNCDIVPFHYEFINGTRIYRNKPFETQNYNATTNRWEITNPTYTENATTLQMDYAGWGVTLNKTVVLLKDPGNWQFLPNGSGYYLVMKNGTCITINNPWGVPDNERWVTINGRNYLIGWPNQYYTGTYQGQTLLIRGGGDGFVHNFYYTDLGVAGGTKYELPYLGAMATSWWDLEGLESEGRKLRTFKSLTMNGVEYVLYFDEDTKSYYIIVDGKRKQVTYPTMDVGYSYSKINGVEYWNVEQNGWILRYGTYSDKSGQFSPSGTLETTTGYDPAGHMWSENNRYGYDRENATLYITAPNGTRINLDSGMYLIVWKVQVGNRTYYTTDQCDSVESVTDNKTGQIMYMNYFTALNNEKVYFNWNNNPANWLEEIHIPITGTNYTRLIPFSWQPQQVFDKIYVYNITIPALPSNSTHTGVYYENGSEVPVDTNFKVFGTYYGPGTRYDYGWNGNWWVAYRGSVPGIAHAPWNSSSQPVNYFITLDGTRIYSFQSFGWTGNDWGSVRQWNYINSDPVEGNKTATVVEGGYCVYLNDTIKVDVTTPWPNGGLPDQYLIMSNGTYFSTHWRDWPIGLYFTMINDKGYFFRSVVTYYNLTDSGTVYNIADPIQSDYHRVITPSVYQAPVISTDRSAWVWMNATTDSILHDGTGYYLINALNSSRLNLQLVDNWWNLSAAVRRQVFPEYDNELRNYYPRFNVTLNGRQFFVIDPSPVTSQWDNENTIENAMYRYPSSINVVLGGTSYNIVLFDQSGCWRMESGRRLVRRFETIVVNGTRYEVEEQQQWKPSYQVTINGQTVDISLATMNIYKRHTMWGEIYTWMLTDLSISTSRQVNDIIVGTPNCGMWGIKAFDVVKDTGAIDLDGDLTTTGDQYFVRRIHGGSDLRNETIDRMWVELVWDPNASRINDEIHISAWMGKLHEAWTSEWNETYMWYYASNMTQVSDAVMQKIKSTVINSATGTPNPGYWDISYMVQNQTWADLLNRAKKEHWDWMTSKTNEWDWMWFGTQQDYTACWASSNGTQTAGVGLRYEFAGLSLYNDTVQTHYYMPKSIGNTTFVTPGEAFGNMSATGSMIVPLNATITFGVTYDNVSGTLFPYSDQRSMWGWWDSAVYGADFNVPNFMNKPTPSTIDHVSFAIHFSANQTSSAELNNEASMKIDQHIGNWNLEPNVIDGREQNSSGVMVPLMGNDVLLNRSLASNYYVTAFSGIAWDVMNDKGTSVDNNNVTESSHFDIASKLANASFATVKLGSTYDWGKPTTATDMIRTLNVTSKTSPIGAFRASYQSEAGKSSTGFDISAMMYFLSVGFKKWDGYAVYNDPEVMFLLSKGITAPIEEQPFTVFGQPPWVFILIGSVAAVTVVLVIFRAKVRKGLARLKRSNKLGIHSGEKTAKPQKFDLGRKGALH